MQLRSWGLRVLLMDPTMIAYWSQPVQMVAQSSIAQSLNHWAITSLVIKLCKDNQWLRNASAVTKTTLDYLTKSVSLCLAYWCQTWLKKFTWYSTTLLCGVFFYSWLLIAGLLTFGSVHELHLFHGFSICTVACMNILAICLFLAASLVGGLVI